MHDVPVFLRELARRPLELVIPGMDEVTDVFGLHGRDAEVAWEAYELSWRCFGPAIASIAAKMLTHCRGVLAADPNHVFFIAERDGGPIGTSLRGLAPDLAATQFRSVGISRLAAEAAVIDGERRGLLSSDALEWLRPFRKLQRFVREPDIDGAYDRFNRHLEVNGVYGNATAIDLGIAGNPLYHCQVLAARSTTFHGLLVAHCADKEADPLWERKQGVLVQVDTASRTVGPAPNAAYPGWRWLSNLPYLPDDPDLTMASMPGTLIWESSLVGPAETVRYIDADGRARLELQDTLPDGDHIYLNPVTISDKYRPVLVRAAVRTAVQLGIHDYAREVAAAPLAPGRRERILDRGYDRFIAQARNWITGDGPVDPQLREFWRSFAMRPGSFHRNRLRVGLAERGVRPEQARGMWHELARIPVHTGDTFARHKDYVDRELARIDREYEWHNKSVAMRMAAAPYPSVAELSERLCAEAQSAATWDAPRDEAANWRSLAGRSGEPDKGLRKGLGRSR